MLMIGESVLQARAKHAPPTRTPSARPTLPACITSIVSLLRRPSEAPIPSPSNPHRDPASAGARLHVLRVQMVLAIWPGFESPQHTVPPSMEMLSDQNARMYTRLNEEQSGFFVSCAVSCVIAISMLHSHVSTVPGHGGKHALDTGTNQEVGCSAHPLPS
jgi:hypothetical protein